MIVWFVADPASGGTNDYAYAVAGVKYSYTVELRGPGFNPEASSIEPAWREHWAGFRAMITHIDVVESRSSFRPGNWAPDPLQKKEEDKETKVS